MGEKNDKRKISLCWDCKNAYVDKCEWVGRLEKIWDKAIEREIPRSDGRDIFTVYTVTKCKHFKPDTDITKAVG